MKNLKMTTLAITAGMLIGSQAMAEIGYIDYARILDSYPAAQQAVKEIDAKALDMQQFMVDKEKQYKNLDTPLKKQNFVTEEDEVGLE